MEKEWKKGYRRLAKNVNLRCPFFRSASKRAHASFFPGPFVGRLSNGMKNPVWREPFFGVGRHDR
jgi:hypothetical protein